jgi:putrescine transport system substrate-binding protein
MSGHRSYFNLGFGACLATSLWRLRRMSPTVHVYNWYDYIGPNTLHDFKRDTGIQPVYDTFDSAEVLEGKLLTSRSGYDVVVASNFSSANADQGRCLAPLPRADMPDFKNMDTDLLAKLANNDPGNQYAVPYLWGTNGIGYNVDKVRALLGDKAPVDSWDLVFKEENLAKLRQCGVAMLDSPSEMLPSPCTTLACRPTAPTPRTTRRPKRCCSSCARISPTSTRRNSSVTCPTATSAWRSVGPARCWRPRPPPSKPAMA